MAMLSLSCEKEGAEASQTREVSFELSLDSPQTRISMTEQPGCLKAAWEIGDEVSVLWGKEENEYETFVVTEVKNGGKTAVLTNASSAMPSDCTIGVYYPSQPRQYKNFYPYGSNYLYFPDDSWNLTNAGKCGIYAACGIEVKGGEVSAINLEQKTSYLLIRKGTVIPGLDAGQISITRSGVYYQFNGNNTAIMIRFTFSDVNYITLDNGNTVSYDIYIPFLADGTPQTPELKFGNNYTRNLGSKNLEPGKVYDISEQINNVPSD